MASTTKSEVDSDISHHSLVSKQSRNLVFEKKSGGLNHERIYLAILQAFLTPFFLVLFSGIIALVIQLTGYPFHMEGTATGGGVFLGGRFLGGNYTMVLGGVGLGSSNLSQSSYENCLFDTLPTELLCMIFNYMDIPSLKSSRLTCTHWNSILIEANILKRRTCRIYKKGDGLSYWDYVKRWCPLILKGESCLNGIETQLRISKVLEQNVVPMTKWVIFACEELVNITSLEILRCVLDPKSISIILLGLKNLRDLRLLDVHYDNPNGLSLRLKLNEEDRAKIKLTKLHLRVRNPTLWGKSLAILIHEIPTNELQSLRIEYFDTGHPTIDSRTHFTFLFRKTFRIMIRNAGTLKELDLCTYDLKDSQRFKQMIEQNSDLPREHNRKIFKAFLIQMENFHLETIDFPLLDKISLCFRLTLMDRWTRRFDFVFLEFMKKLKKLKEFHFSQIYTTRRTHLDIQNIINNFAPSCHCVIETLCQLRGPKELVTRRSVLDIELVLILDKDEHIDDEDYLFAEPSQGVFRPDDDETVLGYKDSTVQLKTEKINWTFLYVEWKSLVQIQFYTQNLAALKKIKIDQSGVHHVNKIKITDEDIQAMCKTGLGLTHLEFIFCDLDNVSDSGLTGLSESTCRRMIAEQNFQLQDGDLTGRSISSLQNLRVLKLICIGDKITDIIAHHAFSKMPRRLIGGISGKHKISPNGMLELSKHFFRESWNSCLWN